MTAARVSRAPAQCTVFRLYPGESLGPLYIDRVFLLRSFINQPIHYLHLYPSLYSNTLVLTMLRDDGRQSPIRQDMLLAMPREDGRQLPIRQDMVLAMPREDGRQSPIRQDMLLAMPREEGRQLPICQDMVLGIPREDGRQSPIRQYMVVARPREDGRQCQNNGRLEMTVRRRHFRR